MFAKRAPASAASYAHHSASIDHKNLISERLRKFDCFEILANFFP